MSPPRIDNELRYDVPLDPDKRVDILGQAMLQWLRILIRQQQNGCFAFHLSLEGGSIRKIKTTSEKVVPMPAELAGIN